jgi:hypothetical protein
MSYDFKEVPSESPEGELIDDEASVRRLLAL